MYLAKRNELSRDERARRSVAISNWFFERIDLDSVVNLHLFMPIKKFHEIDTWRIIRRIWLEFPSIRTFVPRVDFKSGEIESVRFTKDSEFEENAWGICEPTYGEIIEPGEIDMVLVPLLAFDKLGHRVGYGKGFYDRFLGRCRSGCLKIGVSFFPPVNEIESVTESDVPLDCCITPEGVLGSIIYD